MGMTIAEKILAHASGSQQVSAGEIVWAKVDVAMMDDILGPRVSIASGLNELQAKVWDPDKVVIISDHYTPPASVSQAEIVKFTRDWAKDHDVKHYYEFIGPCHQAMVEHGHVRPWRIIVGTDSHTCMGGALGAFATGIGSTEMLGVLATGEIWFKVPETIRIEWKEKLPAGVMAKDIALASIGKIGHAGATYMSVEFTGEAIEDCELDQRMAITNMAVEMGAKVGLMEPDHKVADYLAARGITYEFESLKSDHDAKFYRSLTFSAHDLKPQVACPHSVDNVYSVDNLDGTPIQQAYLGSCTGGRYSDLVAAAQIVKGHRIANGVRFLVSPASQNIWKQAAQDGILSILAEAGATILAPTCGLCVGVHSGLLASHEACISSTNRNFIGRMGSKESNIYLASPMTVAASALTGKISSPIHFLD